MARCAAACSRCGVFRAVTPSTQVAWIQSRSARMDRKVLIAIGLSVGIAWFWMNYVMVPPAPDANKPAAAAADGGSTDKAAGGSTEAAAKPAETTPAKPAEGAPSAAPLVRQPETFSTVEIPGRLRANVSSWGAGLHDLVLTDPRYLDRSGEHAVPLDLVAVKDAPLPFAITFPDSGFDLPADADFKLEPGGDANERRYSWESGPVKVLKRWRFVPNSYEGELEVTVENHGDKPLSSSLRVSLSGRQDPDVQPSMFRPSVVQTEGLCSTGKVKREALSSLLKESAGVTGPVRVIAIDRKYFALAAAMTPVEGTVCQIEGTKSGRVTVRATQPAVSIGPGANKKWTLLTFTGPKVVAELDSAKIGGEPAHLGDVMNYGFTEIFARPMLWVLKAVHRAFGNWGVAIILLTLLIKLVTWWPTAQSMKSAQAMAKLKPEMDRLKEKYGEDKARMNQEVMALYQKHKINPLGGCLPVLIQMPIYIALYSMLGNSVELYGAHFAWVKDLTAPEGIPPVLPLLTVALMFVQQKLSPAAVDPSQKTMMTMMPVMFTGMSLFLPAGLTLYILTNTALSIVQQRLSTPKTATDAAAPAAKKKKAER
jgi:YidC/Oxa1 family membrane protein insertase